MKIRFAKLIMLLIVFSVLLTSCVNDKDKEVETQQTSTTVQTETSESTMKETTAVKTETSQTTPKQTTITQTEPSKQETVTQFATTSQISTTKITEETTKKVTTSTENEEDTSCDMPEVVFVINCRYYQPNGFGFYINNKGEVMSYDFRPIDPDWYTYIGDSKFYNRLKDIGVDTDFDDVSKEKLTKLCEKLLNVSDDNELIYASDEGSYLEADGEYALYAARYNENKEIEIISLGEYGDFNATNNDSNANELFEELKELFPDPYEYIYENWRKTK